MQRLGMVENYINHIAHKTVHAISEKKEAIKWKSTGERPMRKPKKNHTFDGINEDELCRQLLHLKAVNLDK